MRCGKRRARDQFVHRGDFQMFEKAIPEEACVFSDFVTSNEGSSRGQRRRLEHTMGLGVAAKGLSSMVASVASAGICRLPSGCILEHYLHN
jgi:hypothetical protein